MVLCFCIESCSLCSAAFTNCCFDSQAKPFFNNATPTESGALPLLVAVLKDGSAAEKEHAAGALWHLAHDSGIKIILRELGKALSFPALF